MKLVKLEQGFYYVFYRGVLIGEVQKRGELWYGYAKGRTNYFHQVIGNTRREAAVLLII